MFSFGLLLCVVCLLFCSFCKDLKGYKFRGCFVSNAFWRVHLAVFLLAGNICECICLCLSSICDFNVLLVFFFLLP